MISFKNVCVLSILLTSQLYADIPEYIEQQLTPNDLTGIQGSFGNSVAVSKNGKILIAGAPSDGNNIGSVIIFKLQQDGWHQAGYKLVAQNTIGAMPRQGTSVIISADDTRIASGAPDDNSHMGAVFIFDYNTEKATWKQTAKIVSANVNGTEIQQGYKVKLDPTGNTLVFSGIGDNNGQGAAWVYAYNGTQWNEQAKLVGSNAIGQAKQGSDLAISEDGATIALGASDDEQLKGAAYIFTRTGSTWTQQGSKIRCTDITDNATEGAGIALTPDGETLFIGAPEYNNGNGATCKLSRSDSHWLQQGNKFQGTGTTPYANQGQALTVSGDGKTLLIGAPYDNNGLGTIWRFNQIDVSSWVQQGKKITPTGVAAASISAFGYSVAASKDGTTLVIGGPEYNLNKGGVWVFYQPEKPTPSKDYYYNYWVPPLMGLGGSIIAGLILWRLKVHIKKRCWNSRSGSQTTLLANDPAVFNDNSVFSPDIKA